MGRLLRSALLVFLFLVSATSSLFAQNKDARMMVHLLDYIAADYPMAVDSGIIISEGEYAEMQEFVQNVTRLGAKASDSAQQNIVILDTLIHQKASPENVALQARAIKKSIIRQFDLVQAPGQWPSFANAKKLYAQYCQSCHGVQGKGDGALSVTLNPKPTNFHDPDKADALSPFQAYNTIRLGVSGTGMQAFTNFNDQEVWDLAFYVLGLPHSSKEPVEELAAELSISPSLEMLASSNNEELIKKLSLSANSKKIISALRVKPQQLSEGVKVDYLELAKNLIQKANTAYLNGKKDEAREFALTAYLEGVEPIEMQLSASDANFVGALEGQLSKMRGFIESEEDAVIIQKEAKASIAMLSNAQEIIADSTFSPWLTFTLSSTIILREGLEAFLVIITILGIIRALKLKGASKWIHGGWIAALIVGFLMWLAADRLFDFSGAQREIMEGFIALFAVGILLYVGFWMHSKSEAGKWQAYVKNKIQKLASKENMIGLSVLSFLVVFREAFESVLFLSALSSEAGGENQAALGGGIFVAFILLAVISILLLKYSKKLPITQLFKYSAIIISVLALVLVGKGIHALQEAGMVGISSTDFNLRIELLGIYPTWQSILAQLITLVVVVALWRIGNKPLPKTATAP